ncbi:flagellar hook-basal body complex protein FliE [Mixta tenebrionis]|uniref:Flagellar hook-basal body complex protein FliE n=1 Tax=Mixta tenebrionis TaxID=2562439 RepID=A0A506V460_9GAMM|nr:MULTISPECIES: flagellar hook-basal body complex protein FliE [Mixta]QHM77479.1 Flagellar hook-basal body complex protein FliE [Mixta theicola]TPW40651.1 flagellar hook-basal body complex protein FliE [Mixta tenebrionis]
MSIQSTNVLDQIQFQARKIAETGNQLSLHNTQQSDKSVSFSDLLINSLNNINQLQSSARNQAESYFTGAPGIGLNDVMVAMQKSSVALNLGIQVRNKLVSAYQEIMSMSV